LGFEGLQTGDYHYSKKPGNPFYLYEMGGGGGLKEKKVGGKTGELVGLFKTFGIL